MEKAEPSAAPGRRLRERLSSARPPAGLWLAGMAGWGLAMAVSALLSMTVLGRLSLPRLEEIALLYFAGGALAWIFALPCILFFAHRRPVETRFAAAFLFLGLSTVLATAFLFAMQYRLFYAQWHAPFATRIWVYQFVATSAGAVYQFAVLGLRLAFPLAPAFLVAAGLYLARRSR